MSTHWTTRSTEDFVYRISSDFALQIENKMDEEHITQSSLADKLGVTPGRVSQVLRNPGNLTLKKMVEYARSLGMKVSVVAYEDGDPENLNGPINSQIFSTCWQKSGKPTDFFSLQESTETVIRPTPTIRYVRHLGEVDKSGTYDSSLLVDYIPLQKKYTNNSIIIAGVQ